jgi:hypothetical protein
MGKNGYPARAQKTETPMASQARPRARKGARTKSTRNSSSSSFVLWRDLGVLRMGLVLLTLAVMASAPKPATPPVYSGWELWPTLMAPVLAPILLQVVLLDALMGRVLMGSATGTERARYRRIMIVNLVLAAALTVWWLPYFAAIVR